MRQNLVESRDRLRRATDVRDSAEGIRRELATRTKELSLLREHHERTSAQLTQANQDKSEEIRRQEDDLIRSERRIRGRLRDLERALRHQEQTSADVDARSTKAQTTLRNMREHIEELQADRDRSMDLNRQAAEQMTTSSRTSNAVIYRLEEERAQSAKQWKQRERELVKMIKFLHREVRTSQAQVQQIKDRLQQAEPALSEVRLELAQCRENAHSCAQNHAELESGCNSIRERLRRMGKLDTQLRQVRSEANSARDEMKECVATKSRLLDQLQTQAQVRSSLTEHREALQQQLRQARRNSTHADQLADHEVSQCKSDLQGMKHEFNQIKREFKQRQKVLLSNVKDELESRDEVTKLFDEKLHSLQASVQNAMKSMRNQTDYAGEQSRQQLEDISSRIGFETDRIHDIYQ